MKTADRGTGMRDSRETVSHVHQHRPSIVHILFHLENQSEESQYPHEQLTRLITDLVTWRYDLPDTGSNERAIQKSREHNSSYQ